DEDSKALDYFLKQNIKLSFSKISPDILQYMIEIGKISGGDLVHLCTTDSNTRRICQKNNFQVFRSKLLKDYGIDYDKSKEKDQYNPMELYKRKIYDIGFIRI